MSVLITQEMRDRARANSDALSKEPPCADTREASSCLNREHEERITKDLPRSFRSYRVDKMCVSCRAYWYAEMCALTLEGRA